MAISVIEARPARSIWDRIYKTSDPERDILDVNKGIFIRSWTNSGLTPLRTGSLRINVTSCEPLKSSKGRHRPDNIRQLTAHIFETYVNHDSESFTEYAHTINVVGDTLVQDAVQFTELDSQSADRGYLSEVAAIARTEEVLAGAHWYR